MTLVVAQFCGMRSVVSVAFLSLFIYGLLNDACGSADCIMLDYRLLGE